MRKIDTNVIRFHNWTKMFQIAIALEQERVLKMLKADKMTE